MRAVCALGPLMSAFALLALGGRVLGSRVLGCRVLGCRVLGSRWRSGLGRAPTAGMHRGSAPARRSGVAAVLAVVAVLHSSWAGQPGGQAAWGRRAAVPEEAD